MRRLQATEPMKRNLAGLLAGALSNHRRFVVLTQSIRNLPGGPVFFDGPVPVLNRPPPFCRIGPAQFRSGFHVKVHVVFDR